MKVDLEGNIFATGPVEYGFLIRMEPILEPLSLVKYQLTLPGEMMDQPYI